ncbi:MAG: hypothetical protein WBB64_14060 [Anaerolineales bacterium]
MKKNRIGQLILILSLAIIFILTGGCQSPESQSTSNEEVVEVQADPGEENTPESESDGGSENGASEGESGLDPIADAQQIQQLWETSSHAAAFVVDDQGNNNSCAQCHAPINWMPTIDDIPETCLVCKFELETPPPHIAENEWLHVPCLVCHEENKKGVIQPEYTWLEIPALEEYASVETPSELCLKCHDTDNVAEHGLIIVGGDHADMQCTECHQPHSSTASCDSADCHPDVFSSTDSVIGHDEEHQDVSCAACHDSAGWEVGPDEDLGYWTTYGPWSHEIKIGEADTIVNTGIIPFTSHEIVLEALCERCHFSENPWDLEDNVETPK